MMHVCSSIEFDGPQDDTRLTYHIQTLTNFSNGIEGIKEIGYLTHEH